jgi:flavin-binding protein dodecin
MSVAKNIEITATSPTSFEDAVEKGIARATKTMKNVRGAWIKDQKINISDGKATEYQVSMIVTFVLEDSSEDDD